MNYDGTRINPIVSPLSTVSSLSNDATSARRFQATEKNKGWRRNTSIVYPTSRRRKKSDGVASRRHKKSDGVTPRTHEKLDAVTTNTPMSPDNSYRSFLDEETYDSKNHSFFTFDASRLAHSEQLSEDESEWQHFSELNYEHGNSCWSNFFTSAAGKLHLRQLCFTPSNTCEAISLQNLDFEYEDAHQSSPEERESLETAEKYRNIISPFTDSETSIYTRTKDRNRKEMRLLVSPISDETLITKNLGMQGIEDRVSSIAHEPREAPANLYKQSLADKVEENESVSQVASRPIGGSYCRAKEPCNPTSSNRSSTSGKTTIQALTSIFRDNHGPSSPSSRSEQSVQSKYALFSDPGNPLRIKLLSASIDYEEIGKLPMMSPSCTSQASLDHLVSIDNDNASPASSKALLQPVSRLIQMYDATIGTGLSRISETAEGSDLFQISDATVDIDSDVSKIPSYEYTSGSPSIGHRAPLCESQEEQANAHEFEFHDNVEVCIGPTASSSAALELQNEKGIIMIITQQSSVGAKRNKAIFEDSNVSANPDTVMQPSKGISTEHCNITVSLRDNGELSLTIIPIRLNGGPFKEKSFLVSSINSNVEHSKLPINFHEYNTIYQTQESQQFKNHHQVNQAKDMKNNASSESSTTIKKNVSSDSNGSMFKRAFGSIRKTDLRKKKNQKTAKIMMTTKQKA